MAARAHRSQFQAADTSWVTFVHQDGKVHATLCSPSASLSAQNTYDTKKM